MGMHKKHDSIQKQKCSIDDKKEWKYTHNNQHPPVRLFCGRTKMRKICSGWQTAAPNRLTFSRLFHVISKLLGYITYDGNYMILIFWILWDHAASYNPGVVPLAM